MVALTPRFTLSVAMCSIMAVSLLPTPADAAVIPATRSAPAKPNQRPAHVQDQVIPLPMRAMAKSAAAHKLKAKTTSTGSKHRESKSGHKARITEQFQIKSILRLANAAFGKPKPYDSQDEAYAVVGLPPIMGVVVKRGHNQQPFSISPKGASAAKRHHNHGENQDHTHAHPSRHYHGDHNKVIVKGKGDHVHVHRRDEGDVSGIINIMSNSSTGAAKKLASLALDCSSSLCIMDASETNSTQVTLQKWETPIATSGMSPAEVPVRLKVVVSDPKNVTSEEYCVGYKSMDQTPQSLTAKPCDNAATNGSSQTFAYNPETSVIRPMWYNGQDDGMGDSFNNSTNGSLPAQTAGMASASDLDARSGRSSTNVTLVFVPNDPEVNAKDADEDASTTVTSTVIMTVTSTITSTGIVPTPTVASAESLTAADATSTFAESIEPSSTSTSISSTASPGTSSTVLTSVSPITSATGVLAVEVVGSMSSASATGPSIDVQALASSIAASDETTFTMSPSSVAVMGTDATRTVPTSASTVTPVDTAPYQWAFKTGARL